MDYNDFDPAGVEEKKERYLLDYLGSVQCAQKGVEIIVQVKLIMQNNLRKTFNQSFDDNQSTNFVNFALTCFKVFKFSNYGPMPVSKMFKVKQ